MQVQLLLAKAAALVEDWPEALGFVKPLTEEGYGPAWVTAAAVARESSPSEMEPAFRQRLLAFAVAHCGLDEVSHPGSNPKGSCLIMLKLAGQLYECYFRQ